MNKKIQDRFPRSRKGYDKDAVNSFIALEQAKADEVQSGLRECINALKDENDNLKKELAIFKGREEQIKLALISATDTAKRLNADVRLRYQTELERLRLFRAKWINAYEQLKERYHFDKDALNVESVAVSVEIELKKMLAKDFGLDKAPIENEMEEHFRKEVERLTSIQMSKQAEEMKTIGLQERVGAVKYEDVPYKMTEDNDALIEEFLNLYREENAEISGASRECVQDEKTPCDSEVKILKKKLEDIKAKRKKSSGETVAFSLDEALNPTDSLEQNCQVLSLAKK